MTSQEGKELRPTEHELKCWPPYFGSVLDDSKPFEVRRADRDFKVGDVLWLREWIPGSEEVECIYGPQGYTGRECRRVISYVLAHGTYCAPGTVVLGFTRPLPTPDARVEWMPIETAPKETELLLFYFQSTNGEPTFTTGWREDWEYEGAPEMFWQPLPQPPSQVKP